MKTKQDINALLERAASQIRDGQPGDEQVQEAAARVWSRLSSDGAQAAASAAMVEQIRGCEDYQALIPAYLAGVLPEARKLLLEDHSRECVPCRRALKTAREGGPATSTPPVETARKATVAIFPIIKWGLAAAAVLAGLLAAPALLDVLTPSGPSAVVRSVDGDLFRVAETSQLPLAVGDQILEGETVRSGREGGSVLQLTDGTLVELRARSEVTIDQSRRGTTIDLERGSVIVQAAEQSRSHLFVATDDCLVSVTGTIFSVNHGIKGSRVSVIEGEVRVSHSGEETVLYPGEQLTTHDYLGQVSFANELGWSRDVDQYLTLLEEYSELRRDIRDNVPRPGLRYDSRLLDLMPEDTVLYAALPNLGETITETRRVLRERLDASPALAEWWQAQGYEQFEPMVDEIVARLGELGEYLGAELVVSGQAGGGDGEAFAGPLVLAEIVSAAGFQELVEQLMADLSAQHGGDVRVVFLTDPFAPVVTGGDDELFIWLHPELAVASPNVDQIRQVASFVLRDQANPFTETSFYASIAALYEEGVDILVAADLEQIVARTAPGEGDSAEQVAIFERTGFRTVKHLMAEQKQLQGNTQHRVALTFSEERTGIASWLAAPAPMGSLDFISPDAKLVMACVFKDPVKLLDDLAGITGGDNGLGDAFALFEERHGLSLRDDFAAALGGEIAFAIDGPLLPTPAWKLVLEVYDPARFQWTLEEGLADLNARLAQEGEEALELRHQKAGGRTFYVLPVKIGEIHYTYVEGYLVMAPSRALLDRAIRFRNSGYSITDSGKFTSLLPADGRNNFSGIVYQDVSGIMQSVAESLGQGQLTAEQQQAIAELRDKTGPTLGYAYGEADRIILAASTEGDALSGLLLRMLGLQNPVGFEQVWKETLQGIM